MQTVDHLFMQRPLQSVKEIIYSFSASMRHYQWAYFFKRNGQNNGELMEIMKKIDSDPILLNNWPLNKRTQYYDSDHLTTKHIEK